MHFDGYRFEYVPFLFVNDSLICVVQWLAYNTRNHKVLGSTTSKYNFYFIFIYFIGKQETNLKGQGCSCQLSDEKYLFEFNVEEIRNIQVILRHSASISIVLTITTVMALQQYACV